MKNETASAPESAGAELPGQDLQPAETATETATIKVVVIQQAVTFGKIKYLKNQVIECTQAEADAFGKDFVRPYSEPTKK